jgi:hypothetical protein
MACSSVVCLFFCIACIATHMPATATAMLGFGGASPCPPHPTPPQCRAHAYPCLLHYTIIYRHHACIDLFFSDPPNAWHGHNLLFPATGLHTHTQPANNTLSSVIYNTCMVVDSINNSTLLSVTLPRPSIISCMSLHCLDGKLFFLLPYRYIMYICTQ